MTDKQISVLIPARNEQFLARTIEDLIQHSEADTEIIAVLDGAWANPSIPQHPMVNVIYLPKSIGQRAATNMAARLARGKYFAKVDAHCSFDQGWDRKMLEGFKVMGDNTVMVPVMKNLWAFDWKCMDCGLRTYQGPTIKKCSVCGGKDIRKKMVWKAKDSLTKSESHKSGKGPLSTSYCFDSTPHFQYFNEWTKTETYKQQKETGYTETMSLQGSFFMCSRAKYLELNLCDDETFGSWGSQGIEVSQKVWNSGGKVLCNLNTWYGHLFRTQGGDFGFPYQQNEKSIQHAKKQAKKEFFYKKGERNLVWLLDKFWPVKGWTEEEREKLRRGEL